MLWKIWDKPSVHRADGDDHWFVALQDEFMDAVKEAEEEGTLGRGGVFKRLGLAPGGAIVLDPCDREMAECQAAARSMSTQEYVRMLVHNALLSREP